MSVNGPRNKKPKEKVDSEIGQDVMDLLLSSSDEDKGEDEDEDEDEKDAVLDSPGKNVTTQYHSFLRGSTPSPRSMNNGRPDNEVYKKEKFKCVIL